VTASEFSFLALGLILGVLSGAALVEIVRARPPVPREVRLTVAPNAIPGRATTLADDAFVAPRPEPARGGPADRRWATGSMAPGLADRRTAVRLSTATSVTGTGAAPSAGRAPDPSMAGAIPITPGPDMPMPGRIMEPALPLTGIPPASDAPPKASAVGIPISSGDDPTLIALRLAALPAMIEERPGTGTGTGTATVDAAAAPAPVRPLTAVALLDPPDAPSQGSAPVATERCAEERRLAAERCELATRARAQAESAADALRLAQRAYDAHEASALEASSRADPRAIHAAKEAAQGGFRAAVRNAGDPDALEAAARDWLTEINRINNDARDAAAIAAREHAASADVAATLERLTLDADAARIGAANADAACLAAREAVAECDERAALAAAAIPVTPSEPVSPSMPGLEEDETLGLALEAGGAPRIFRMLHGDRAAMSTVVLSLAGDDPEARRFWQLQLTGLVEAIVADAIEAAYLEFPDDHTFWGSFTRAQNRDITQALSSLGFRFDGLGGWTDGRAPSQRDMSLALGYAGLDPMRVRNWPNEAATTELFRDVTVSADEYLAGIAGDLTLGEMVTMLGRRADGLAETWNQWGRIRPLLLEEA